MAAATLVVIFFNDSCTLSVNCVSCSVALEMGFIDYVVWLGDKHFVGF